MTKYSCRASRDRVSIFSSMDSLQACELSEERVNRSPVFYDNVRVSEKS